jgi:hypothetical protein
MPYLFNEDEITSIASLLNALRKDRIKLRRLLKLKPRSIPRVWFRGLPNIHHPQVPTFHREGLKIKDEIYLMNLFKQNSHELLSNIPDSEWEWMFLMRHHNLPSRLLDWTENPLVGLYFAVRPGENDSKPDSDGVLWCLLPTRLNRLALGWPDDNYSLPMFTENKAEYTRGENEAINLYLPSKMRDLTPSEALPPAAAMAKRTNRRMQVQMAVFTIHHMNKDPLENSGDGTHVWRYKIPAQSKKPMYEDLRRIGITERTLFPSLDNVAKEAIEVLGGH